MNAQALPHLSFSRMDKYLHCPEQYRLYYLENLRPRIPSASLAFGQTIHQALAFLFSTGGDPVDFFGKVWGEAKGIDLHFSARESWEKLSGIGESLLEKFLTDELPRLTEIQASEKSFELSLTNLEVPFIGVIDLIARRDGKTTVVDFKTSASAYAEHEVAMSDQLTAYHLAVPEADRAALMVFVKTKEPRIDWYVSKRSGPDLAEFVGKAGFIASEIQAGHFFKRPGKWCSYCDFLPVCLADFQRAKETLIQVSD